MMTLVKLLAPMLLVAGMVGCSPPPVTSSVKSGDMKPMDTRAQDVADIKTLEEQFSTAFRQKDVNAIMQLCVSDNSLLVFDVHPPREINGPQNYRKDWEETFDRFSGPLQVETTDMEVTVGGDVAFAHYIHHVIGTLKGGTKTDFTARVTDCFKKINGRWLIAHTHVSVPVDMQTGKADTGSKP